MISAGPLVAMTGALIDVLKRRRLLLKDVFD